MLLVFGYVISEIDSRVCTVFKQFTNSWNTSSPRDHIMKTSTIYLFSKDLVVEDKSVQVVFQI